jgi:hypothetical protein
MGEAESLLDDRSPTIEGYKDGQRKETREELLKHGKKV